MIYKLLKPYFLKRYLAEQNKANKDDYLVYVGSTQDGKKWYRPKEESGVPIQRLRHQQKYITWLASGVSQDALNILCDESLKQLETCVSGKNNWHKVASLISQIKERSGMVYAPDLILNVVASILIREDEEFNPQEIDLDIHDQKVNQLDKEADIGTEFFFTLKDTKELSDLLTPSEKKWKEYKEIYQKSLKVLDDAMKIYSSETLSTE